MSLINEALKRAEANRRHTDPPEPAGIEPASGSRRRLSAPSITVTLIAIGVVAVGGAVALALLSRPAAPQQAAAAVVPYEQELFAPPEPTPQPIDQTIRKTREALDSYQPAPPPASSRKYSPSGAGPLSKATRSLTGYFKKPAAPSDRPANAFAALPAERLVRAAAQLPASAASRPAAVEDAEIARSTAQPLDPAEFKVNGIIHGPNGARAIINGRTVRVGQRIAHATVVRITTGSVELQSGSQRITISM